VLFSSHEKYIAISDSILYKVGRRVAMTLKFSDPERHILTTKAGISRQLIDQWERGTCNPGKDNALVVVEYTGRDLVDVLYGRNPEDKNGKAPAA
jgi:hypothetical protein